MNAIEVREIVLSLVASVVAGSAVWMFQRLHRYRRVARRRAFFGVTPGVACALVAPRHFSSPEAASVHRRDMAALVELASVVNGCGGRTEVITEETGMHGIGRMTEFCVGGPTANPRTAALLRALMPGVGFDSNGDRGAPPGFSVGATEYPASSERAEYAVLARAYLPDAPHPVFVVAGQTARSNLAAARLLASRYPVLRKAHGVRRPFCLVVKVVEPLTFGPDLVEIVADGTESAFRDGSDPDLAVAAAGAEKREVASD